METDPYYADIDFDEYSRSDFTEEAADFWESLDDAYKLEFLTDSLSHLTNFSREVNQPRLADFLPDALTFYELYGTWETYLCPDQGCLRLFPNSDWLIIHLKCQHFPEIQPIAWPLQRHSLAEERLRADALRKMVWKPIVVKAGLDMLSSMCLDYQHDTMVDMCSGSDGFNSLNWLYSEDPKRKSLLLVLAEKFQILLAEHEQASFSLLSEGYLKAMFDLASKLIFVDRPHRYNMPRLQEFLARFPFSFCLLEAADLERFVEIVEPMCQFVRQFTNLESNFVDGDANWESENQDTCHVSQNECLFYFPEAETLRYGDSEFTTESILSLLCHGPCMPAIPSVSPRANEVFTSLKNVLNELRVTVSAGPFFEVEGNHLQLVHRVHCLESKLREACTFDCRVFIVSFMRSFLRMKLYFCLRCRRLDAEEDLAALCPTATYQEDSESECDSDDEEMEVKKFDYDLNLHYKPWRDNPTLCHLDSTLSESATGETEGSGPFFWLAISDVPRHCEKNLCGAGYESVRGGIKQFRLNKTWKYWLCYGCDRTFIDRESHMVHLENEHQLSICDNEYWLIPGHDCEAEGRVFESGLENSITLDHTYDYFLVDSTEFFETLSDSEVEEAGQGKHTEQLPYFHHLDFQFRNLKAGFELKRNILRKLDVWNAFSFMLFNGSQPLPLLVSWLRKLSIEDWRICATHQLQFRFLSQLLDRAHASCFGVLSNNSVLEALQDSKNKLIHQLLCIDHKILRTVYEIEDLKCRLSLRSKRDHRTKILPSVRSLLHAKFKFDSSLRSLEFSNVKEFLLTLNQWLDRGKAYSFKVQVASPGKVVINTMEKSSWALAFIGIRLRFSGKWFFTGETELTGVFKFGGWSNWGASSWGRSGSLTLDDHALMESISCWRFLEGILCTAVSDLLQSFAIRYGAKIRCHGVGMSAD